MYLCIKITIFKITFFFTGVSLKKKHETAFVFMWTAYNKRCYEIRLENICKNKISIEGYLLGLLSTATASKIEVSCLFISFFLPNVTSAFDATLNVRSSIGDKSSISSSSSFTYR